MQFTEGRLGLGLGLVRVRIPVRIRVSDLQWITSSAHRIYMADCGWEPNFVTSQPHIQLHSLGRQIFEAAFADIARK